MLKAGANDVEQKKIVRLAGEGLTPPQISKELSIAEDVVVKFIPVQKKAAKTEKKE